jgi:GTP cyclohydrolase I
MIPPYSRGNSWFVRMPDALTYMDVLQQTLLEDESMDRTVLTATVPATTTIADVQSRADTRRIPIDKVGIKDIRHPVRIKDRGGQEQHTVATFNMYVYLPHHFKGTHMSRFVAILNGHEHEIGVSTFREMLSEMAERLESEAGHIEMRFPFFIDKKAPISGVASLLDYDVTLIGDIHDGKPKMSIKVVVPVTSLCPCSKQISDYGAHNQRSHVTVEARTRGFLWIEELIEMVEAEASCELYGLLKRPDEKYVTERAYDNPKFVEDTVRDVARRLNDDERISAYIVEAENFESIHNHSAYALIECDKEIEARKAGSAPDCD